MSSSFRIAAIASAACALLVAYPAAAQKRPPPKGASWVDPKNSVKQQHDTGQLKPARNIQRLSSSLELKVGVKVSYKPVHGMATLTDPSMGESQVNEKGILTILPKKAGTCELFIFPSVGGKGSNPQNMQSGMKRIRVRITP